MLEYNNKVMKHLYNRYFPTPSYLMMKSFAIDISDQSIKYGELLSTPLGLRLGRFGKEKIPPGVVVSGEIQDQEKLSSILKKIGKKENINFVRVSLPEEQMYLFTLFLPKVKEKELKDIILLQIEEHIPLKAMDTVFEYEIVLNTDTKILVLVSAIARTTVEAYLSVFKIAGLEVISFELEAQAIARAVIHAEDKEHIMVVDFGDTRTGVSIVYDGRVFFTTTLDIGGINLTNMIAKNFSLSSEKAEDMKRSYGLDGVSNIEDIFPVILNGISVLRDELNKQYEYWKTHEIKGVKNYEINRIILCGGDANLTGLSDYLEASMKIRVTHANTWINISEMKTSIPDMSFEESLGYATILGLALGEFSYFSKPVVNVLPEEEKSILKREYWKRFSIVLTTFIISIIFIAILLLLPSYFLTLTKQRIAEAKLDEFNTQNVNLTSKDLDKATEDINNKTALLSSIKAPFSIHNDIFSIVLLNRPDGINISQILFNQRKDRKFIIEVSGVASDRGALRSFKESIDSNIKVASTEMPISNYIEKTNLSFNISIILK